VAALGAQHAPPPAPHRRLLAVSQEVANQLVAAALELAKGQEAGAHTVSVGLGGSVVGSAAGGGPEVCGSQGQ
jgi:hypothetical protein